MPPKRGTKRKTTSSTADEIDRFPAPPTVAAKTTANQTTPSRTGADGRPTKRLKVSIETRQQLIDNLQLELAGRARKLRAQLSDQIRTVHSRCVIRVNRIPTALRTATMGELQEKWKEIGDRAMEMTSQASVAAAKKAQPSVQATKTALKKASKDDVVERPGTSSTATGAPMQSPKKRVPVGNARLGANKDKSAPIYEDASLESNVEASPAKRGRADAVEAAPTARAVKSNAPSRILSPKSGNPRTFQAPSPMKLAQSTSQANIARATSPTKSAAPVVVAAPTASSLAKAADKAKAASGATRTASRQGTAKVGTTSSSAAASQAKMGTATRSQPVRNTRASNASEETAISTGTTIVKGRKAAAPASKTTMSVGKKSSAAPKAKAGEVKDSSKKTGLAGKIQGLTAKSKKAVGTAPEQASAASGGRTLRKRDK